MIISKPVVSMFPGQGTQYYHMGEELYQGHPVFKKWMDRLDRSVGDIIGGSVLQCLYDDRRKISKKGGKEDESVFVSRAGITAARYG